MDVSDASYYIINEKNKIKKRIKVAKRGVNRHIAENSILTKCRKRFYIILQIFFSENFVSVKKAENAVFVTKSTIYNLFQSMFIFKVFINIGQTKNSSKIIKGINSKRSGYCKVQTRV